MSDILTTEYYGNTAQDWLISFLIILGAAVFGRALYWVFGNVAKKLTQKTKGKLDDIIIDMIEEPVSVIVIVFGIDYALVRLSFSEEVETWVGNATQFVVILTIAWMIARLFDALFEQYLIPMAEKSETDLDDQILPIVRKGTRLIVWTLGIIIALNNAGYDVGAAVAGLGIGGIALAMAGRDTIANMFGGLMVFTDQPFTLNDRIKIAGFDGIIEEIGLRSTRLRTLEGRMVTIPNAKFTESCVENVAAEPSRKVVVTLGLTYDMSPAQMKEGMAILKKIVTEHELIEEDIQVAFSGFGDFSMNLLLIYRIMAGSDNLEVQTAVNLAILEGFNERGLDMAFPTQTVYTKAA